MSDKDWKDLVSEWNESARSQVCPECGASPVIDSYDWRWDGEFWQHYHGYPIGHIQCVLKDEEEKA